jgi:hypothetical protein
VGTVVVVVYTIIINTFLVSPRREVDATLRHCAQPCARCATLRAVTYCVRPSTMSDLCARTFFGGGAFWLGGGVAPPPSLAPTSRRRDFFRPTRLVTNRSRCVLGRAGLRTVRIDARCASNWRLARSTLACARLGDIAATRLTAPRRASVQSKRLVFHTPDGRGPAAESGRFLGARAGAQKSFVRRPTFFPCP